MANLIGSLQSMRGAYALPPCKWPGCRDAAQTTGLFRGGLANLCPKHIYPWCQGSDDDQPEWCDDCHSKGTRPC